MISNREVPALARAVALRAQVEIVAQQAAKSSSSAENGSTTRVALELHVTGQITASVAVLGGRLI